MINGTTGAPNVGNALLENDLLNGAPVVLADITATVLTPATPIMGGPVPVLNTTTGVVSVPAGTPAGTYTINYQICENLNPANCDDATITVTVVPPAIVANDDPFGPTNGTTGDPNLGNAFDNDLLNGAPVVLADITATVLTPATPIMGGPVPVLDPMTGIVSVPAGTPAGTYTITYQICENLNPGNCDDATITVTVVPPAIVAVDDNYGMINGTTGDPNVGNALLENDLLNGAPVVLADITATVLMPATPIMGGPVPVLNTTTGVVGVPAGTPAGTYTITYQICENLNPANCDDAVITVTVVPPAIVANDDTYGMINGTTGAPNVGNALLENDLLNGAPVVLADITATVLTPATPIMGGPVPVLDPMTGIVSVPAGTPAGTYTINYQICENLNPSNCDDAVITVTVVPPAIVANDDPFGPTNGTTGDPNVGNAFDNDLLNGAPVVLADITATVTMPATSINGGPVPVLDPMTGIVSVPAGTPAGTYTITYQICENLNPSNCDDAVITVTVVPPAIVAVDDNYGMINGTTGNPNVGNALLENDLLNGAPVVLADITATVLTPATPIMGGPVPVLDPMTGIVSVPAGTPAGTYTITYQICENLNPANCDDAVITVTVVPPAIVAVDDNYGMINGTTGDPNVGNALLENDLLNGAPVVLADITATVLTPATPIMGAPVPVLDPMTGIVSVPAGTPAGTYTINYQICENLNPATATMRRSR
jgi:large repetitive protein